MNRKLTNNWLICGLIIAGLGLRSCEQDVDLYCDTKFIPVVYCLLNPQEQVQTVRISRVFQDRENFSAWEQKYDSFLRDTMDRIYIERIDGSGFRTIYDFTFSEEIMDTEVSGFALTRLYNCNLKPRQDSAYQLYAYFSETRTMSSAKIRVLSPVELVDPATVPGRKMVIDPTQPYVIRWYGSKGTAYYQGIFNINYLEKKLDEIQGKTISMVLDPVLQYPQEAVFSQNLSGVHLLRFLVESIPEVDSVKRKIVDFDFTFIYGGEELALFTNSGINPMGLSDRVSDYSNLDNSRGVFSSISRLEVYGIPVAGQSIDTIAMNPLTRHLNFVQSDEDF